MSRSTIRRLPLASVLPGVLGVAAVTAYVIVFLTAKSQTAIAALLMGGAAVALVAGRLGAFRSVQHSFAAHEGAMNIAVTIAMLVLTGFFYDDHFTLLLIATVMLYMVAALGLTVQFGYAGVLNFAGAAFFGTGCYTAAVLTEGTALPHLLVVLAGGATAALIGALLLLPVLRTRGHYSAVVTIAFALLFTTFLEVNNALGGPQGLSVAGMNLFGWELNDAPPVAEDLELSFFVNYVAVSAVLLVLAFSFVRRLDRSWVGLNMDAVRLDETASACFGYNISRWKITAFTAGNLLAGLAGAVYAMMLGFIAPTNFTFGASLVLVSIVLLGGIGNPWGVALATAIVILVPEKLQIIQEYRFLIYSAMVILILLFRPLGLLPRQPRSYFPGWQSR